MEQQAQGGSEMGAIEMAEAKPTALSAETIERLKRVPILASLTEERLHCLDGVRQFTLEAGDLLVKQGDVVKSFCILLEGSLRVAQLDAKGHELAMYTLEQGSSLGELPLLASLPATVNIEATRHCELLELNEEQFWSLMTTCPEVRREILGNMALRLQKMQSTTFQQEKLAALGTMAAGLMHELNNPGSAARRAASQLRENLMRMHRLSPKFALTTFTAEQKQCMFELQEYALSAKERVSLSSLEQSDAEEALAEWMEEAHIEDAWKLAPSLVAMGINAEDLQCARSQFAAETFADTLSWLEALVSSMQLVGTIEESIGRVSDLVQAVKSYAYEGQGKKQSIDVNKSIHATLVILGHKLREKQITLEKSFASDLPPLESECQGLNQIWTNLLDNAIDASPQHGRISIRTWAEVPNEPEHPENSDQPNAGASSSQHPNLCIAIKDNGSGIPLESQPKIFDPFYTTKPVGVGTGLGLGIVYRIVEQYGGKIWFSSVPGETEFFIRLPSGRRTADN
jgi:signal transduction histidine kinase